MPILKGIMGFTRFWVHNEIGFDDLKVAEKLNLFKFRPLHPHGEDNESHGWCAYLSEYETEYPLNEKDFLYDQNIVLALRIDTIKIPKELLKSLVKKSIAVYQRDHKKFPDKVVKKEIELAETKGLKARLLPRTKIIEAVWSFKTQELRIFSRSPQQIDRFNDLFQQTFNLRPTRRDFVVEATRQGVEIDALHHQPLFLPKLRIDVQ